MFQCRSCFSFCLMQCVKLILCTCLLACMHTHCNCSEGKGIVVSRTLVLGLLASHAHAFNDHETLIDTTSSAQNRCETVEQKTLGPPQSTTILFP